MRLFHVSEEPDIERFEPRLPDRRDMDQGTGLVWAIDEARLPNFLTPRNCPRVAYYAGDTASAEDIAKYFSSGGPRHVVTIERAWLERLENAALYLYEFDPKGFILQDDIAGYYVSSSLQTPIASHRIGNLPQALRGRDAELRVVDNLWEIADAVKQTTLNWSLCRMGYAQPRTGAADGLEPR